MKLTIRKLISLKHFHRVLHKKPDALTEGAPHSEDTELRKRNNTNSLSYLKCQECICLLHSAL